MMASQIATSRDDSTVHQLVITPHPMHTQGQRSIPVVLMAGDTLADLLERQGVHAGEQWRVELNGVQIPDAMWAYTRPKDRTVIECRRIPERDALALIATIAIMVYAPELAGTIGITSKIGIAVFQMASALLIQRVLAPPKLGAPAAQDNKPTYSISGASNQARLYQPMGLVLGEPYCVPDLGSQAYTYFVGEDVFLTQIFHAGVNCDSVNTICIGDTAITAYEAVTLFYDGFVSIANTGMPSGSVDTVAGALLDAPTDYGPYVTRTSSANTVMLAVDLEATLYITDSKGSFKPQNLEIELEYRQVGSAAFLPFVGARSVIVLTNGNTRPLRVTYQLQVPVGQYEVRARKDNANSTDNISVNAITWTQLKSYQVDTGLYGGQGRVAVSIKASGQLSGALDQVNWMARSKAMPIWNGAAWVTATTRANGLSNPGALFLLLARGIWDGGKLLAGLGWDDSRIDVEGLKAFMVRCTAKGFTFDLYLQEATSIDDVLEALAYAGMATKSFHTGKIGVVWMAEDDPVSGVINMASIKAKSFSVDYNTAETADELVLSYFDRNKGNVLVDVRVVAPGVTTPTNTSQVRLLGITTEAHASVLARFAMAQNVYMRKGINLEQDLEHMAYHRSTVLSLSHDLTQWGYGGRLHSAVNVAGILTLELDDVIPAVGLGGVTTRFIGLRLAGETQFRIFGVNAFAGTSRTVTLSSAWPGGVAVPGDSSANPARDCLWIYDFKATPGLRAVVASIEPQANMSGASVILAPLADEFWPYVWNGTYVPASSASQLQALPAVSNLRVSEQLQRQNQGFYSDLTLNFDVSGSFGRAEVWGAVNGGPLLKLGETLGRSFTWSAALDQTWALQVRPFSLLGRPGGVVSLASAYAVIGLSYPLLAMGPVSSTLYADHATLTYDAVPDARDISYEIRFGSAWASATVVNVTDQLAFDVLLQGVYWVAPLTLNSGKVIYGAPASAVVYGAFVRGNILATKDQRAGNWVGIKSAYVSGGSIQVTTSQYNVLAEANVLTAVNVLVADSVTNRTSIQLVGQNDILSAPNVLAITDVIFAGGVAPYGEYAIPVADRVNAGRVVDNMGVRITFAAQGVNVRSNILAVADILTVADVLNQDASLGVRARPQIRVAVADGIYGPWQDFIAGAVQGQYVDARMLMESDSPDITCVVSDFVLSVDVPDRRDLTTLTSAALGTPVVYTAPFNGGPNGAVVPNVQITLVSAVQGDDISLTAQSLGGFTVQVLNAGVGVARTLHALSSGY